MSHEEANSCLFTTCCLWEPYEVVFHVIEIFFFFFRFIGKDFSFPFCQRGVGPF